MQRILILDELLRGAILRGDLRSVEVTPSFGFIPIVKIRKWLKNNGENVVEGDTLLVVTVGTSEVQLVSPATGSLKRVVFEGTKANLREPIGCIIESRPSLSRAAVAVEDATVGSSSPGHLQRVHQEDGAFLAIDFGTSNSSMAWYNPASGSAEIIRNAERKEKTPSVVYYGDTETLVGDPALSVLEELRHIDDEQDREREGSRLIEKIKRILAGEYSLALPDGREVTPVDVAAKIIGKLKDDAETGHFHEEVKRVVLTCPAEFGEMERELLERAARQAGFEEVALLEEPEAAAIAYARAGLKVGNGVLVYDLGGGTFDLALVRRTADGRYERAMPAMGDAHCGGNDFDQALYDHWDEKVREEHGRGLGTSEDRPDRYLLAEARRRKEDLTDRDAVRPFAAPLPGGRTVKLAIDRPTFETLIAPRVDQTVEKAAHMYREAKERGQEVDTVVLIGGASLIPLIKRRLAEVLPLEPRQWQYQEVAVALGAAYHGRGLWGEFKPTQSRHAAPAVAGSSKLRPAGATAMLPEPGQRRNVQYKEVARLRPPERAGEDPYWCWEYFSLSPDGQRLAIHTSSHPSSSFVDARPRLFDITTGCLARELWFPPNYDDAAELKKGALDAAIGRARFWGQDAIGSGIPNRIEFCSDNRRLAVTTLDNKQVLIYDVQDERQAIPSTPGWMPNYIEPSISICPADLCKVECSIHSIAISSDAQFLVVTAAHQSHVFSFVDYSLLFSVDRTGIPTFSTCCPEFALRNKDTISIWDCARRLMVTEISAPDGFVYDSVTFTPDGRDIICHAIKPGFFISKDVIERWEFAEGRRSVLSSSRGLVTCCPDGSAVAVSRDNEIELLDPNSARQVGRLASKETIRPDSLRFSANARRMAFFVAGGDVDAGGWFNTKVWGVTVLEKDAG